MAEPHAKVHPTGNGISGGITKLEYFAAMAMQGLLANPHPDVVSMDSDDVAKYSKRQSIELLKQLDS